MKKYIVTLGATIMIAALAAGCSASQPTTATPAPTPSVSVEPTATPTPTPTPTPVPTPTPTPGVLKMVGIPGSHIKDIQLGVSKFGMEDDSAQAASAESGCKWSAYKSWTFPDTDIILDYNLLGDDDSQFVSGTFGATWDLEIPNEIFCTAAKLYLGYIATMPYDTADPEAARQWVEDNMTAALDDSVSTTIGDAEFTLTGATTAGSGEPYTYFLQIQVVNENN